MRDRLIEIFKKTRYTPFPNSGCDFNLADQFNDYSLNQIVDKFLANGVIVPPCKVGQAVWVIVDGFKNPMEGYISKISFYEDSEEFAVRVIGYISQSYEQKDFGKIIFFSKEAAQTAIKEREG